MGLFETWRRNRAARWTKDPARWDVDLPSQVPIVVHSPAPVLRVVFYRSPAGREPVRDWLRSLEPEARRVFGEDISTVQYGWPLGMPLVRSLGEGIWEVRSQLRDGIGRVLFLAADDVMVLLHGFLKKTQKTPTQELEIARRRAAEVRRGGEP